MNGKSKVSQKVVALVILTLAICFSNIHLPGILAGQAKEIVKQAKVGTAAPLFSLKDIKGKSWRLKDQEGKVVVLEWFNHSCPFVKKHYDSGNMQALQKQFMKKGVVWLSICSSAEGRQGYHKPKEHNAMFKKKESAPSAVLVDSDGNVGKMYGAKSTPQMYIIGKDGMLVYAGAIDDTPGFDKPPSKAKNFVKLALNEVLAGKEVSISSSTPYGCSVKYAK